MDIKQLEFFLEMCKTDSFTRAAKNLFITTPGLVKSMEKLEDEMGARLFVRTRSGTYMTAAGYELQRYAKNFLNQFQYIKRQVHQADSKRQHTVDICMTWGLMSLFPGDFFSRFIVENRDITLKVISHTLDECVDSLVNYRSPIGLLVGDVKHPMLDIVFRREAPLHAIFSEKHPLAYKESLTIQDLHGEKVVVNTSDTVASARLSDRLREGGITPQIIVDGADWSQTLEIVRNADFISFCVAPRSEGFKGTIIRPVSDLNMSIIFNVVILRDIPLSDAERRFIDYVISRITNVRK
ncbi:MAG: LysR family transcriptional regulator [Clostridia bacterium]|nr:LysR family transcriptional regulator [Clostridia bacterium]